MPHAGQLYCNREKGHEGEHAHHFPAQFYDTGQQLTHGSFPDKEVMNGFLEFTSTPGEMQDFVSLLDEGAPGQMGAMGLSMGRLKRFHGKEVVLSVELLRPRDEQARLPGKGPGSPSLKEGNT